MRQTWLREGNVNEILLYHSKRLEIESDMKSASGESGVLAAHFQNYLGEGAGAAGDDVEEGQPRWHNNK